MYAMVEIQGNQYKAEKGASLTVDRVAAVAGEKLEYDTVLMVRDEANVRVGEPYVMGAKVTAVVEEHVRGEKVLVFKYKRRKRYKRTRGHRQDYSVLRIEEITA
jgi:large subunit ribosomal protein L21